MMRDAVMAELHDTHAGIVLTKSFARMHIWWPGISNDREQCVRQCEFLRMTLGELHFTHGKLKIRHGREFTLTLQGHLKEKINVDDNSRCFFKVAESHPNGHSNCRENCRNLRSLFSRYGLPRTIATNNGPQFTSSTFEAFCKNNGICHKRSAPYHPSTDGEAEHFVQSFKTGLRIETVDLQIKFLMHYRSLPHTSTGKTPAELMF